MTRKRNAASRVASSRVADDLKLITGIGPAFEKSLHDAGIRTFAQLAKQSPEDVATHIPNLSASQIRKQGWVLQARKLASKKTRSKTLKKKSTVPTTTQHYENFTLEFLLNEKNKLRRLRIMHVQSGDVETWANWKQEEVSHFLARHTGARIPEGRIQKPEATTAKPKFAVEKTKPAKSVKPKSKRSPSSTQKSVKPTVKTSPKITAQKPEAQTVPDAKKGQAKSVPEKVKQVRSSARRSAKPVVKTPPRKIFQKSEKQPALKVEQDQAKFPHTELPQSKNLAPIIFKPAAEVLPRKFLQKSNTAPTSEEEKSQAVSSQSEAPQVVRETRNQIGMVRLLKWNTSLADSDQPVQSLPHDQNFEVKLTLDISGVPIPEKSKLDISGTLLAKKLGGHERRVIGETQEVIPYSPIINLRVGKAALEQGLYRLEAQIKLNDAEETAPAKSIYTSLQGGLFQVY